MLPALLLAAADGEAPNPMNPEPWVAGTALVVWLVAFAILAIKVWPVITKGLDERNDKILGEIKAAEDARSQAKQALAEYEKSLADAREEEAGDGVLVAYDRDERALALGRHGVARILEPG